MTARCHRILWEKDKENVVLGGVKSYLTGRKIAEQQIGLNRTTNNNNNNGNKNNYLNNFNHNYKGSVNSRFSHLTDRSLLH